MKVEPPRTAVDPLATVLAQVAAGRTPDALAVLALRQMLPAATVAGILQGKTLPSPPGVPPVAATRALDASDNLQSRMPPLADWHGAAFDDDEPAAPRRIDLSERPSGREASTDLPDPAAAPRPAADTAPHPPPAPVEPRRHGPEATPHTPGRRAEEAASRARARAAKIWIMRGPAIWIGVSLLLTLAAFTLL